ncbi:MAG: 50S ribosomal protein L32 [Verrucomicrobiales bacterium]
MPVPKRKVSKSRSRMRRAANRWRAGQLQTCSQCGSKVQSHIVCPSCGYYNGRQVQTVEVVG